VSVYARYREYRAAGFAPGPAAQSVAELYGRRTRAEVAEIEEAMALLEARDGSPLDTPLHSGQSTTEE
jgi:hypothetical protein